VRAAKVDADLAPEESKADPQNRRLRVAAENAAYAAAEAGRRVAELEFEARVDEWLARDEPADDLLVRLAPRVHGEIDWYWVGGATLSRQGVKQRGKWAYYRLAPETLNVLATLTTTPAV
jgi:hypothetical protein